MQKIGCLTPYVACLGQGHEIDRFFAFFSMRFQPGISTVCPRIVATLSKNSLSWSWVADPHAHGRTAPNSQFWRIYGAIHHLFLIRRPPFFRDFDHLKTLLSFCRYFSDILPVYLMTWLTSKFRIYAFFRYAQLSLTR